ncbi:MAG: EamA family transporter [Thermoleophilia bacterium]|nr:EamA family transporter [Thermoleophilia bacterium]
MSRKGWALFIALCVIWGIPYLLIRVAVEEMSPPALVFFRTAVAAVVLLPLALRRGQTRGLWPHWRWILAYTIVELAVPWLLLSHAEQRLSSSMAGLIVASVPLIAVIVYRAFGVVDHVDARRLIGLLVGFAGVAALVGLDFGDRDGLAMAEVGLVAVCYAVGPLIISRRLADLPSLGVVVASLVITTVLYAPWALATLPASVSAQAVGAVATLSLVCTALAFILFFALIYEVGPARSTVITYINPLVAVLLGVWLLAEPFTLGIAVGLPLILLGSVLGTAPAMRRAPEEEPAAAATP